MKPFCKRQRHHFTDLDELVQARMQHQDFLKHKVRLRIYPAASTNDLLQEKESVDCTLTLAQALDHKFFKGETEEFGSEFQ